MIEAVLNDSPRVTSLADLLFQLYERLGLLLYRNAANTKPEDVDLVHWDVYTWLGMKLEDNLEQCAKRGSEPFRILMDLTSKTNNPHLRKQYRNAAEFFRGLVQLPDARSHIPQMLRGRSHGDLHGRNVLVGRVGERVLWPAVYDYGDMSRANWIALDFVKLEVEFKVRLYPVLFPVDLTKSVCDFEERLNEATERFRKNPIPPLPTPAIREDRCRWLLLQLRWLAMQHLSPPDRHWKWLTEYYFQLALYGLNAARFDNTSLAELQVGLLCAGCAMARYAPLRN
jgi:hypothetical protein